MNYYWVFENYLSSSQFQISICSDNPNTAATLLKEKLMSFHPTTIGRIALELNKLQIKWQVEIIHIMECLELIWTASNGKITYVYNS